VAARIDIEESHRRLGVPKARHENVGGDRIFPRVRGNRRYARSATPRRADRARFARLVVALGRGVRRVSSSFLHDCWMRPQHPDARVEVSRRNRAEVRRSSP